MYFYYGVLEHFFRFLKQKVLESLMFPSLDIKKYIGLDDFRVQQIAPSKASDCTISKIVFCLKIEQN